MTGEGNGGMEVVYQLEPAHFTAYQNEAARRLSMADTTRKAPAVHKARGPLAALLVIVVLTTIEVAITRLKGGPPNYPEQFFGFLVGAGALAAITWEQARRAASAVVRPDMQASRERRLAVTAEGLKASGPTFETLYRWPVFKEVAVHGPVIVAWIEPDFGVMVPAKAFASDSDRTAFVEAVRSRIVTAKLPQAGALP